ncbi:MAG TPA: NADPH:quinone oxidoreductase family protein, partial [Roseiarcus sp.]|nr:NADPH:quinone oxidoreductase family protein [Roseiarcus sp.]
SRLVKIPDGLALDKAAGLSVTYGTSMHALEQRAKMKAGETLFVLGASGGVGLAAVEIGKAMGARVIAGASSEEKLAFTRRYGAAETINTAGDDMRARLKELAPKGVDVVYDPVGGPLTEAALRSLAWKGRLLVIGFASGEIPRPPLNIPLLKGCDIRGVYWGEFIAREPEAHRENVAQLMDWAKSGTLSVHVHATYPLEEYRKAFDAISKRQVLGKTLLQLAAATD